VVGATVRYHLDSSACVTALRLPTGEVPRQLELWSAEDVAISSIVAAELEVGVHKSSRPEIQRARLNLLFARLRIDSFDESAAKHYGEIRAELEKKGISIGPLDLLIAAHARSLGATIITANAGEFKRVKGLKVLAWR
jgi:tRNA(fMet)-specific endonuclease VapC